MRTTSQQAAEELRVIEQARVATVRRSADNGVALIVLGLTFLLDMVAFDLSRPSGSPFPAVIFLCVFNVAIAGWLWWYTRRLPIRLRRIVTSRVVFLWSWFYVALIGLGVGGWVVVIGWYPPLWFTLLGVIGAAPLLISGMRLWRRAHAETALAVSIGATE